MHGMLDDLALLTGPDAADLLTAALAVADQELLGWRVRSVDHRPGRSTTAAYDARVRGSDGEPDQVLGASTGLPTADVPGLLRLSDGEREVVVWRFPLDPGLPALPAALDEARCAGCSTASAWSRARSSCGCAPTGRDAGRSSRSAHRTTRGLAERWRRDFERAVDPADLRARVAGVMVSLATGPSRVQSDGWPSLTRPASTWPRSGSTALERPVRCV